MTDKVIKFDISFQDESIESVLDATSEAGATEVHQVRQRGIAGLEWLVVGMVAVPMFVNLVVKLAQIWSCGVRVDARTSRILTEKDCTLEGGSVLVITEEGSQLHRPDELSVPKISDVLKGLG